MNKIQVSTTAKPRDEYTSKLQANTEVKQEWIPRKPEIDYKLKIENESVKLSDDYVPVCITYRDNDIFVAPENGCVVYVLCVGGSGYGTMSKRWGDFYNYTWSNPVYGWQVDDQTDYKTGYHNFRLQRKDYVHRSDGHIGQPSSFGRYISASAGLSIDDTTTQYQNYRTWLITGKASAWDWGRGQSRNRSETQNVRVSSGQYDGELRGTNGEVRFGIFRLSPKESVPITIGSGVVKGHIDIVYFELRNGNDEAISKPSRPNDVLAGLILPNFAQKPIAHPLTLALKPSKVEIEVGNTETLEIISNATTFTFNMDNANASFDEATRQIIGQNVGDAILTIEASRDTETITRALAIKVIEKQAAKPASLTQPQKQHDIKMINPQSLMDNILSMNTEELAYMYIITLLWNKVFKVAQNDGVMTLLQLPLAEKDKEDLQTSYDEERVKYAQKATLQTYGASAYQTLATHIMSYPFLQTKDDAHLQVLEALVQEDEHEFDGMTFTHTFNDNVKNMSSDDFTDNLTVWMRELDGIIVRQKANDPIMQKVNTLDSLNVVFSRNPNSYVQRVETQEQLKTEPFNIDWEDPIETDYIHELYWFIIYDELDMGFDMQQIKQTWVTQKNHGGDKNFSNTPEKRQTFINGKDGALAQIFKKAYETDMKDELFDLHDVAPHKMKLKDSIYQLGKNDLLDLFTRACQKAYAKKT